jgi:flagellar biosynthesis protein FlhF
MEIKTYRAESVHAALQMIRRDLGSEAVVLRTREVRGGMWGLFSNQRRWELTASVDVPVLGPWVQSAGPLDRGIDLTKLDHC